MKTLTTFLTLVAAVAAAGNPPKVGTVDLAEVAKKYTKVVEQQASIQKSAEAAKAALQEKADELQKLQEDINETVKRAQSPLLSDSGKQQLAAELKVKQDTGRQRYAQFQQLDAEAGKTLQGRIQEMSRALEADLRPAVEKIAKAKGLDVVLPKAGLLYGDASLDITDAVVAELNANYKPDAPKPAAK